jgi:hypothetical protein
MRKNSPGFGVIGVMVIVLVISLVSFAGYKVYSMQKSDDSQSTTVPSTTQSDTSKAPTNAKEIIAAIDKKLLKDFKAQDKKPVKDSDGSVSIASPTKAGEMYIYSDSKFGAYYQAGDNGYYVRSQDGTSISLSLNDQDYLDKNSKFVQSVHKDVIGIFKAAGLKEIDGKAYKSEYSVTYKNDKTVCQAQPPTSQDSTRGVYCSDITDLAKAATDVKPFADAYFKAQPSEKDQSVLFSFESQKDSVTPGYQTAAVGISYVEPSSVGSANGRFYRKTGGEWQFFKALQMSANCKEYDAKPDAKLAFKGTSCINEDKPQELGTV